MSKMGKLKEAFTRGALAAVHVDLQNCYFREKTMEAYPVVNDLAASLRSHGIANHWVAYTSDWAVRTKSDFDGAHKNTMRGFHRTIQIDANERIFEKASTGAFDYQQAPLYSALMADKAEALIVTGVIHSACVAETICGAMEGGLRVFAAVDATDCSLNNWKTWRRSILEALNDPAREHLLSMTTTHDIKRALSPAG